MKNNYKYCVSGYCDKRQECKRSILNYKDEKISNLPVESLMIIIDEDDCKEKYSFFEEIDKEKV